ncbi:terpenoid synthase [Thozetella sp. PMI_491]|nr:terpenoid synthase [Thozetella sp. PMI_491]
MIATFPISLKGLSLLPLPTAIFGLQPSQSIRNSSELESILEPLLRRFHDDLGYTGPRPGDIFDDLLRGMHEEVCKTGIAMPEGSRAWLAFKTGLFHTYLCYPHHPLEVRVFFAVFTWMVTIIDDEASKSPDKWQHFVRRFHQGLRHSEPLAQAFASHLSQTYDYFDLPAANFIVNSALNFANATALSGPQLAKMTRTTGGEGWPYYLREKDGLTEVYIWFTFPISLYPEVSLFMEAVPDMTKFILLANDVLSFFKEEKAGEKDNYIHGRAFYAKKDAGTVIEEVAKEAVDAFRRTMIIFEGREPYRQAWHDHAMGYVAFHKAVERYKLGTMGLAEEYSYEFAQLAGLHRGL